MSEGNISTTLKLNDEFLGRLKIDSRFKFRVVTCRISSLPTLISKIKWLGFELPLNEGWNFQLEIYCSRIVQTQAILFLKSKSERDGSEIERLWLWMTMWKLICNVRIVVCRIRSLPTLISKIKWFGSQLSLTVTLWIGCPFFKAGLALNLATVKILYHVS